MPTSPLPSKKPIKTTIIELPDWFRHNFLLASPGIFTFSDSEIINRSYFPDEEVNGLLGQLSAHPHVLPGLFRTYESDLPSWKISVPSDEAYIYNELLRFLETLYVGGRLHAVFYQPGSHSMVILDFPSSCTGFRWDEDAGYCRAVDGVFGITPYTGMDGVPLRNWSQICYMTCNISFFSNAGAHTNLLFNLLP